MTIQWLQTYSLQVRHMYVNMLAIIFTLTHISELQQSFKKVFKWEWRVIVVKSSYNISKQKEKELFQLKFVSGI